MNRTPRLAHVTLLALAMTTVLSCDSLNSSGTVSPQPGPTPDPVSDPASDIEAMVGQIDTEADPAFDYAFDQTKFVPPPGQTLLIMGQTLEAIDAYTASYPEQPLPGGWAAYWGIPSADGLATSTVNEFGSTHHHQGLVDRFPNAVVQSALWMVGTWDVAQKTAAGDYDPVIREFSAWANSVERPIYLRIGYEFDGPHNELEPDEYVAAYRRFVDITRAEGVENVAFVWHSYASTTYNGNPLSAWYPGDDYVDWVGISLFRHLYAPSLSDEANAVFEFARTHKKPVMVAETSPVLGITSADQEVWSAWFVPLFSLAYQKNVKAISFINDDWSVFPPVAALGWSDARLQNNQFVSDAWFAETGKDRYLKASPELFPMLGYTP
ncbi:MAG: glycosyl hydrolase [Bacteroidota bacterium]